MGSCRNFLPRTNTCRRQIRRYAHGIHPRWQSMSSIKRDVASIDADNLTTTIGPVTSEMLGIHSIWLAVLLARGPSGKDHFTDLHLRRTSTFVQQECQTFVAIGTVCRKCPNVVRYSGERGIVHLEQSRKLIVSIDDVENIVIPTILSHELAPFRRHRLRRQFRDTFVQFTAIAICNDLIFESPEMAGAAGCGGSL